MKKAALIIFTLSLLACEEDYYPPGLYGYQVERLLTAGDTNVWYLSSHQIDGQSQEISSCEDSLELHFITAGDSISVYELSACDPADTVYYGSMRASSSVSSETNTNMFTDSLLFLYGAVDYLLVSEISSTRFSYQRSVGQNIQSFTYFSE